MTLEIKILRAWLVVVRPGVRFDKQREQDLLWIRRPFLESVGKLPHFVVHGHTITTGPELRPYRLGIDTGAFFTGLLTAAVFEASSTWLSFLLDECDKAYRLYRNERSLPPLKKLPAWA